MSILGTVKNGVVVLDEGATLPDGMRVQVEPASVPELPDEANSSEQPTFLHLLELAGIAKDLPADFAAQHDHYIQGTPKK